VTRLTPKTLLSIAGVLSACATGDRDATPDDFRAYFEEVATVALEEPAGNPIVGITALEQRPRGGYILTDAASHVVRLYDGDGRLEQTLGGSGTGPGELDNPTSALELPDGRVFVTQRTSPRLTVFRPGAAPLVLRVPGFFGSWLSPLDGSLVIMIATREERFAIMSLDGTTEATFGRLDPRVNETPYWIYLAQERAAVVGERVITNTSFFPSFRVFDARGDSIGAFGSPPPSWIDPTAPPIDRTERPGDRELLAEWAGSFTVVRYMTAVDDSLLLVQYGRHVPTDDDPYFVEPATMDVYTVGGRKLVEDVPFPERIAGGHGELLVLAAEPPAPWTVRIYRWKGLPAR